MLSIPIISEFDGKGIDRAIREFKQLETVGEKAQFAIKKAAVPAAAALAAVTAAMTLAVKAAIEDEAQQAQLALTLNNVTGATDKQVKATEDMISAMSRATGMADSELRPALATLVIGTKDIATALDALALAQDISAGSGLSLASVSDALAAAYGGNMKALGALSPGIKAMIKDGASLDEVFNILSGTFGGAAATAADTAAGKFKILKNSLDETQESIGAALLPVVQKVLPVLQKFADWAQDNPEAFLAAATAITAISVAILAVNLAMKLNPFTAIALGVAALVVGIVYAYNKFETFRDIVNAVLNGLIKGFETFANAYIKAINIIIKGMNLINPFSDIATIPELNLPSVGGGTDAAVVAVGSGAAREGGVGEVLANLPTVEAVMPAMPSPAAPIAAVGGGSQGPSFGAGLSYGGGVDVSGYNPFAGIDFSSIQSGVTINVAGGISSAADIGKSVVDALTQYSQVYGPLNLAIR